MIVLLILSIASFIAAPWLAARVMSLTGGVGKAALTGFITLGALQLTTMAAGYLGPLGDVLSIMGFLAAWYQVVKIVHGTDTAKTMVFMFWHMFFVLLLSSLLAMFMGASQAFWYF